MQHPPTPRLNQLSKLAWYLIACELQLLQQYYGCGESQGAPAEFQ